ncbi:hypothetical protein NECAME_09473 [Necator americanus]|uniref:Uncharacterized protein n=1 Tax=Necator americanus TaxID=51031 RepID=W2TEF8_NECAM|nr:hypothetical protein NECAME_09473 [Necator americanus]ETN79969.1 hypothetical protein NECAME_09473 [Necator americanus]
MHNRDMRLMSEVAERYVEQIQTTAETLRRRVVAYYDGIFFLANKMMMAADRARDVAEPVAYDVKDYILCTSVESSVQPQASISYKKTYTIKEKDKDKTCSIGYKIVEMLRFRYAGYALAF